MKLLIINPGSTSTKIAVYEDDQELYLKSTAHSAEELGALRSVKDQVLFREKLIMGELKRAGYSLKDFAAICARGGPLKPMASGTYLIDENAVKDASNPEVGGRHSACLGIGIAYELSQKYGIPAYFVDPVSTDELIEEARGTGLKGIYRRSMFHALNQKTAARAAAQKLGRAYEEVNLVGVHMGGGVSVAAHRKGQVIDNYNVVDEGCFSMERPGSIPASAIIKMCYSGMEASEVKQLLSNGSGVYSHLGTRDFREVEKMIEAGSKEADLVFRTMVYQHAKCIGSMAASLKFQVDAIFLTGGIAYSRRMCDALKDYVGKIAPVIELPGENEMKSLAEGALRVLRGEKPKAYGSAS